MTSHRSVSVTYSRENDSVKGNGSGAPFIFLNRALASTSPRSSSCIDLKANGPLQARCTSADVCRLSPTDETKRISFRTSASSISLSSMTSQVDGHGKTLHQVAREGDAAVMAAMLEDMKPKEVRHKINDLNAQQFAPLHYAARHNHYDMVSFLINKGADVRIRGRDGLSPLHLVALNTKSFPANNQDPQDTATKPANPRNSAIELRILAPITRYLQSKTNESRTDRETSSSMSMDSRNVGKYIRKYALSRKPKAASASPALNRSSSNKDLNILDKDFSGSSSSLEDQSATTIVALLVSKGAEVNSKDSYSLTPLHYAASRGNVRVATELLQCTGINIEARDKENMTPLHLAAINNSEDIVRLLLAADANARSRDDSHATPLLRASAEGNLGIVRTLLEYAADTYNGMYAVTQMLLDQNSHESTALHLAIENGHLDIVQHLLSKGADANAPRQKHDFPLHLAATTGSEAIVRILLENDKRVDCVNANQQTPLHRATEFNYVAIMDLLLAHGADTEIKDNRGFTPLLVAARSGAVEAIECLLERGADPHAVDQDEKSTIYWAVECNRHDALMAMLNDGRSKELLQRTDNCGNGPLHVAAGRGFLAITQSLVDLGCPLELRNEDERTALHLAALNGKTKIVRSLLNSEASLTSEDEDGNTPLHLAASMGHDNVVQTLLEFGASMETRNSRLWTPLDIAARNGHVNVARSLLAAGTVINAQEKTKITSLHLAAQSGSVEVVLFLLQSGADVALRDDQGLNCLEVAIENNRRDVVRAIVQSDYWEKAMRSVRYTVDGLKVTPLRTLIKRMPDIAEDVLARCTDTNHVYPEHPLYTVHFDYTMLEDSHITQDESESDPKAPPSSSAFKRSSSSIYNNNNCGTGFLQNQLKQTPTSAAAAAAAAASDDKSSTMMQLTARALDGHSIKENHPLMLMVRSGQQKLLTHSVCVSLLHLKWMRFGRYFYYANLLVYVTFLALLTTYILSIPPPITPTNPLYMKTVHVGPNNGTSITLRSVCDVWKANRLSDGEDRIQFTLIDQLGKTAIIVLVVVHMFKELFAIYTMRLHYLAFDNIVGWGCYVSSLVLVVDFTDCSLQTGYREVWQWQVGAAAIFLAWINLALFVSKFPYLGIYVVMFTQVCRTFCKVCVVFFFFIVAFAFSFHTCLYYEGSFTNAFKSIIGVTVMMLGEFNFDSLYKDDTLLYPAPAYITFVLAILFVSIVSMNLLTGLAVTDIKEVKAKANLELMAMQVDLVLNLESMLPAMVRERLAIRERSFTPNCRSGDWLQRMVDKLNNTGELKQALTSSEKVLDYFGSTTFRCKQGDIDRIRDMQESIVTMTRSLSESMEILRTDYRQLHKMVGSIMRHQGIEWSATSAVPNNIRSEDESNDNDDEDDTED